MFILLNPPEPVLLLKLLNSELSLELLLLNSLELALLKPLELTLLKLLSPEALLNISIMPNISDILEKFR